MDNIINENIKVYNANWTEIHNHPYKVLVIGGSLSEKTNSLFNLISQKPDIDKIVLHAKDLYQAKY